MKIDLIKKYLLNCFLLTLPIMIWNIVLSSKLPKDFQPEIFWKYIPDYISYGENISRILIFMLCMLMPLSMKTNTQQKGWLLYFGGTIVYFASWVLLIACPHSAWSNSMIGFMAPAYTPIIWLMGIGLIGNSFYFNLPFKPWLFISLSFIFLIFHNFHTYIIYFRTH